MKSLFFALVLGFASISQGAIVCEGQSPLGPVTVELTQNSAVIYGAELVGPQTFAVSGAYDEHGSALFTAPGFSMSYQNIYGCIRKAVITTNLRNGKKIGYIGTIQINQCTGGTTADSLCN